MTQRLFLIGLAVLCAAFEVARDGDIIAEDVVPQPIVWLQTPVMFQIQQNGSDDVTDGSDIEALRDALEIWGTPDCTYFGFVDGGLIDVPKTLAGVSTDGDGSRIGFLEDEWEPGADGAVSITFRTRTTGAGRDFWVETDIIFNGRDFQWSTNGSSLTYDIQSAATHELGRALGLQPSPLPESTMYFKNKGVAGTGAGRTLHADDVAGVCYLYPAGDFSCSSDAECPLFYDPYDFQPRVRTICSGGSCDTIGTVGYGEACAANRHCTSGTCLIGLHGAPRYAAGFCTQSCTCTPPNCAGICPNGDFCDPSSGQCVVGHDDCLESADCGDNGNYCARDKDLRYRCRSTCYDDSHCSAGDVCDGFAANGVGLCRTPGPLPAGAACDNGLECESLSCTRSGLAPTCRELSEVPSTGGGAGADDPPGTDDEPTLDDGTGDPGGSAPDDPSSDDPVLPGDTQGTDDDLGGEADPEELWADTALVGRCTCSAGPAGAWVASLLVLIWWRRRRR